EMKPTWNAAVCVGDMGRFTIAGNFSGFEAGPITDPIILQRDGKRFEYTGQATIGSGAELRVETSRDTLSLSLSEMDEGSWILFELPGFSSTASGAEQSSLAALRDAKDTSYYKDDGSLWVKLVVTDANNEGPVVEA